MTKLHPVAAGLLTAIDTYCARTGMSKSRFSILATKSPSFYERLKNGHQPRLATIDRVYLYMEHNTKAAPIRRGRPTWISKHR